MRESASSTSNTESVSGSGTLLVALDRHFVEVDRRFYAAQAYDYEYSRQFFDVFNEILLSPGFGKRPPQPSCGRK